MRSLYAHRAPVAGLLLVALTIAACSSPTPSRPQDRITPAAGDAPSSGGGFRTDPISGGEMVWNEMYGTESPPETVSPDLPYPPPTEEPRSEDSAYPGPGSDAEATPTALPTKSGG